MSHASFIEKLNDLKERLDPTKGNEKLLEAINSINTISQDAMETIMHELIVKSLQSNFPAARTRFEAVSNAEAGTFSWILEDPDKLLDMEPGLSINFAEWLKSGLGAFHIAGKPGSGKSTLMKLLTTHPMTKHLLDEWAKEKRLIFANFFLWRLGGKDQKTWKGLIGSLLYDIVRQTPSITKILFSDRWETEKAWLNIKVNTVIPLTDSDICAAFDKLINDSEIHENFRMCFFIDGLDEFEEPTESYWNLARRIKDWSKASSSNIKLCISSREYPSIERVFSKNQRIHLHKLTSGDISRVIWHRLHMNPAFLELQAREGQGTRTLIKKITDEAEGVFLWVVLIIALLQEELASRGNSVSMTHLYQILNAAPKELEKFISQIVETIPSHHRANAMLLLAMALRMTAAATIDSGTPSDFQSGYRKWLQVHDTKADQLSVLGISLYFEPFPGSNEVYNEPDFVSTRYSAGVNLINTWCRGLLTIQDGSAKFSHRTIPETIQRTLKKREELRITDDQVMEAILGMVLAETRLPEDVFPFERWDRIRFTAWLLSLTNVPREVFLTLHAIERSVLDAEALDNLPRRQFAMRIFLHNGLSYIDESILNASARMGLLDYVIWEIDNNLEFPKHTNKLESLLAFATWSTLEGTSSVPKFKFVLDTCIRKWKESSYNPPIPFPWLLTWLDFLVYFIFRSTPHIIPRQDGWSILEYWLEIGLTCPLTLELVRPWWWYRTIEEEGFKYKRESPLLAAVLKATEMSSWTRVWGMQASQPLDDLWNLAQVRGGQLSLRDLVLFHNPTNKVRLLDLLDENPTKIPIDYGEVPEEYSAVLFAENQAHYESIKKKKDPTPAVDEELSPPLVDGEVHPLAIEGKVYLPAVPSSQQRKLNVKIIGKAHPQGTVAGRCVDTNNIRHFPDRFPFIYTRIFIEVTTCRSLIYISKHRVVH